MQLRKKKKLYFFAFYFRKMLLTKLNYDIYDKELLTIVAAFQKWRVYLKKSKHQIKVLTDYKNLIYFITIKALNRR
jgi:hypothetical protein